MDVRAYCKKTDADILKDMVSESIPAAVLTDKSGWKRVCQVRGRNPGRIDRKAWARLCSARAGAVPPAGPR